MFNLREFVKKGLISAIGIQADYWVMLTAANWFSKGVLTEEDMIEIQTKIDEKNTPVEPVIEESIEETTDIESGIEENVQTETEEGE